VLTLACVVLLCASHARAQNVQFNKKAVDLGLRGGARVNPSTHALEIEIPLGGYPGRAGNSLPVTLSYSSKAWRLGNGFHVPATPVGGTAYTGVTALYAEHSRAGWTSNLGLPSIDTLFGNEWYDFWGDPAGVLNSCSSLNPCWAVDRALARMPDGSAHELRSTDEPLSCNPGPCFFPDMMYAVDGSRLSYQKSTQTLFMPDGSRYLLASGQYVDRNGNMLTYSNSQWTDTLGRTIPTPPLVGATGDYTYALPGVGGTSVTYIFKWRNLSDPGVMTTPASLRYVAERGYPGATPNPSPTLFSSRPGDSLYIANASQLFNPVVLSQIVLPTGQAYTFTYNVYGEIDKMVMPTGGYESYNHTTKSPITLTSDFYWQGNRGVSTHRVSARGDGTDEAAWGYSQSSSTCPGVCMTAPDGTVTVRKMFFDENASFGYSYSGARAGMPYEEQFLSPPDGAGNRQMLRRKLTEWTQTGTTAVNQHAQQATRNARVTKEVSIILDTGGDALATTTTYDYDADLNVIATKHYDFIQVSQQTAQTADISSFASGAPVRTDETVFLVNDPNVDVSTRNAYRDHNLLALPTVTRVHQGDVTGPVVAETRMRYDELALMGYSGGVTSWTDPGTTVRGNVTTVSRWLDTTNTWLSTQAQYDQTGNVCSSWDAKGNLSQIIYADSFSDGVNTRNTYAFPSATTSAIPDPTGARGTNTALITSTVYDYWTGRGTSSTDANGKVTRAEYNDALNRLTMVTNPKGGRTLYSYSDTVGDLYLKTLIDQDATMTRQVEVRQYFDGLGRKTRGFLYDGTSSTPWAVTDTYYDTLGRVVKVSNPYRVATPSATVPTTCSMCTTTGYDALGRVLTVTTPDGAQVVTSYSGNTVTVTDQMGRKRRSRTDASGQLVEVDEPHATTGALDSGSAPAQPTYYDYDTLGNLRHVVQGTQQRYFLYDSLGRLIRAKNPEQGAFTTNSNFAAQTATGTDVLGTQWTNSQWSMGYIYDENGNLTKRIDANNITTTYTYDALNRNTLSDYSNTTSSPDIDRRYDGANSGRGYFWHEYDYYDDGTSNYRLLDWYDGLGQAQVKFQSFYAGGQWTPYQMSRVLNVQGRVTQETYPSGHTISYNYDAAGRLGDNGTNLAMTGNLGDGVARTYAQGVTYDEASRLQQEQFGTTTPLYHKQHYNVRGQLYDVRLSSVAWQTDQWNWNRGTLINYYSTAELTAPTNEARALSGTDNNGNLLRAGVYVPTDANGTYNATTSSTYALMEDRYSYDTLNRLTAINEYQQGQTLAFTQSYAYDRFGNRTIDQANTTQTGVIPHVPFIVDAATNRLGVPAQQAGTMAYDGAGNLTTNSYSPTTSAVTFVYDAENRIVESKSGVPQTVSKYNYDGDGHRVWRTSNNVETWQVYGFDGELLAEYGARAAAFLPQKEYGYRGGELLVTATNGDEVRLSRFINDMYAGALGRLPNATETTTWLNALGGAASSTALLTQVQALGQTLFSSTEYAQRNRSDAQFITDLYWTYLQRTPDTGGYNAWLALLGPPQNMTRVTVRDYFDDAQELANMANRLYGVESNDTARIDNLLGHLYQGALGRGPSAAELSDGRARLSGAAAQGYSQVRAEAENIGREVFSSAECEGRNRSDAEYVTDLYAGLWQRAPDTAGLNSWTEMVAQEERASVLNEFLASGEYKSLAAALYREVDWLVADHLGTPRMVVDRTGSLNGVKRHDYLPFGEELYAGVGGRTTQRGYVQDNVRQKFGGGYERDTETGLDYAQARYYSNQAGRFTSVDPLLTSAKRGQPQSWNRYSYCVNNPLKYIDPNGLIWGTYADNFGTTHYHWYKDQKELEASDATVLDMPHGHFIYQAGDNQWVRLDEDSSHWGSYESFGNALEQHHGSLGLETQFGHMMMGAGALQAGGQLFAGLISKSATALFGQEATTTTVSVASGVGGEAGEMTIVRTIGRGERLADIINEGKSLTFETGNEHAVVTLANGERALVSGNPYGIRFGDQITRIFGHSHPYQFTNAVGASAVDRAAIQALGQRSSWLAERGAGGLFGVQKFTIGN
jgi:RHS repeat-associated protein